MSNVICLAGLSNTGKSTSFKYLDPEETFIVSCTNKQLQIPGFKKKYPKFNIVAGKPTGHWYVSNNYDNIQKILKLVSNNMSNIKTIVLDDINYCLSNEIMENAMEKGFEKFSRQAKNYYELIINAANLREDLTVVLVSHIINDGTDLEPSWKLFSSGKMLDKTVNIDGLFSYIVYTDKYVDESGEEPEVKYRFRTKSNGNDTCRSVAGCFETKYIEPNLQLVIDTINKFENGENE